MNQALILYFDPTLNNSVWVIQQNDNCKPLAEKVDIASLSSFRGEANQAIAIIPGEAVLTRRLPLPARSAKHATKAIPFLWEDNLSVPIEEMHFALGNKIEEGVLAAAVSIEKLNDYLEITREQGLELQSVIPDYLLVCPEQYPGGINLGDRLLIRNANDTGFTTSTDNRSHLSSGDLTDSEQLHPDADLETFTTWLLDNIEKAPINLLQGQFKPVETQKSRNAIKPIAWPLAASILLGLTYLLSAGLYFNHQASELNHQATELYRELFPQEKRIHDVRKQMEGHLKNAGKQSNEAEFLLLLDNVSTAFSQGGSGHTMQHIRYDRRQGTLTIELQSSSMENVNNFQQQLETLGSQVSILSANRNDAGILARIRISQGG